MNINSNLVTFQLHCFSFSLDSVWVILYNNWIPRQHGWSQQSKAAQKSLDVMCYGVLFVTTLVFPAPHNILFVHWYQLQPWWIPLTIERPQHSFSIHFLHLVTILLLTGLLQMVLVCVLGRSRSHESYVTSLPVQSLACTLSRRLAWHPNRVGTKIVPGMAYYSRIAQLQSQVEQRRRWKCNCSAKAKITVLLSYLESVPQCMA